MTQALSESLEDYLEAIFHIVSAKQAARATDISGRMGVNRSSVTGALKALAERGLVNYAPYDIITLTPQGAALAGEVVRRHRILRDFLTHILAVPEEKAEQAACGMEHHVGRTVIRRLGYLAEYIESSPEVHDQQWLECFLEFCRRREEVLATHGQSADGTPGLESGEGSRI